MPRRRAESDAVCLLARKLYHDVICLVAEAYVRASGLEPALLVKTRASQINGCTYRIDMHTEDARAHGETEQRLYALSARHEAPFFSERERAALAWTEVLARIAESAPEGPGGATGEMIRPGRAELPAPAPVSERTPAMGALEG